MKRNEQLLKKIEEALTTEDCDAIIGICNTRKAEIEKAKKAPVIKKGAPAPKGKSKKDMKAEAAAHADLFGGFVENEYAGYEEKFDDFM